MNKTLLLIIVDFLFLNLIALTRWEKAEPTRARQAPVLAMAGQSASPRDQDLVDLMRLSMEDEHSARAAAAAQLQTAQTALQAREQNLNQLQSTKTQLETSLAATQQNVRALNERVAAVAQDAAATKESLAQAQRELEAKQKEAAQQQQQIAALGQQQTDARQRIENLSVAVKVAEQEKALLQTRLVEAKQQVDAERQEREKAQAQAGQLAEGVGRLADKSGEIAQEIRENRPINANVLFNDFLANRVTTTLTAWRKMFLGGGNREKETNTVLVSDGQAFYALLHASDTPFPVRIGDVPIDWERVGGQFGRAPVTAPVAELRFLALDPRIIVVPVDADLAARLGVKVYKTVPEPFKLTEAMLVSHGGAGYGEVSFKLEADTPQYVHMDNRLIKHLVGEFTPSAGDLVFSKTGELLGIMVNSDYCAVIGNFAAARTIKAGADTRDQRTGEILAEMVARLQRLPYKLQ